MFSGVEKLRGAFRRNRDAAKGLSQIFDPSFYRFCNPELVQLSDTALLKHFRDKGWRAGLDPCSEFNVSAYIELNHDVASAGVSPLYHYLTAGREEGRVLHLSRWGQDDLADLRPVEDLALALPAIDTDYLRVARSELADLTDRAIASWYLVLGWKEGVDPSPNFSTRAYLSTNADVAQNGENPLVHYLRRGRLEGRLAHSPSEVTKSHFEREAQLARDMAVARSHFDPDFYRKEYPDFAEANDADALRHYMIYGWKEGRDPSAVFSTRAYLESSPDLRNNNIHPLLHYALFGKEEGRAIRNSRSWTTLKKIGARNTRRATKRIS